VPKVKKKGRFFFIHFGEMEYGGERRFWVKWIGGIERRFLFFGDVAWEIVSISWGLWGVYSFFFIKFARMSACRYRPPCIQRIILQYIL
jgi:hypothetical protein